MKKVYLFLIVSMLAVVANASNFYVDAVNGNDALNSGTSESSAFKTINKAVSYTSPGDTVFIMNGTYTSTGTVVSINRSGSAGAPIVYTNYPGHFPKLQASANSYAVINIAPATSYITINGLEIVGYGASLSLAADTIPAKAQLVCPVQGSPATTQTPIQKYNGHGITGDSRSSPTGVGIHHIVISNNKVHDNCASGIGFLRADYLTIEGNTVYNNSWYTIYGTSGITFNQCYNFDNNTTTYRNIVRNNICYGNRMYLPFYNDCKVTDGNGIILDVPLTNYNGRSLVVNNICFNNGGSGIHSFSMNNTDIFHNISYMNSASPEINSANIYALQANNIRIMNNIIVARPGKRINGVTSSTNLVYDYNIYYGTTPVEVIGTHSFIQDPKFVNPSLDPAVANFRLQAGSIGVNAGDNSSSYPTDYVGTPRPFAGTVDIGAYESNYTGTFTSCTGTTSGSNSLVISNGNGNGIGEASASTLYALADTKPSVSNQKSRKAFIYPAALLGTIPANTVIKSLKFRRAIQISPTNTAASTDVVPANTNIKVYLRNEASDNLSSSSFDWTTILPETSSTPATLVYGGEAGNVIGNAGGWKEFAFQVPFTYTGGNLGVYVEYVQNGSITSGLDINWIYDNGGSQPLYNTTSYPNQVNGFKFNAATGNTALSNTLTTSNERRPVVTISYCTNSLPVNFLSFNATSSNGKVLLSWSTTNEINNSGYDVQRSSNGNTFETIGTVAAALNGNGSDVNKYQFMDEKPSASKIYYRLKQKDTDGKFTYSKIISLNNIGVPNAALSIYPNPVENILHAAVNTSMNKLATIQIQDVSGRIVSETKSALAIGYNSLQVDVSKLNAGIYLFVVQLPDAEKMVSKFVKK